MFLVVVAEICGGIFKYLLSMVLYFKIGLLVDDGCEIGEISNGVVKRLSTHRIHFFLYCPDRWHHWWYVKAHVQGTDIVYGRMFQVDDNKTTPAHTNNPTAIFVAHQIL